MEISPVPSYSMALFRSMSMGHGGKISIAVSPQSYVFAQFRHISGTPAPDGQSGAALSHLRILDMMIDRQQTRMRDGSGSFLNFTA
jgi:hypothetical protein